MNITKDVYLKNNENFVFLKADESNIDYDGKSLDKIFQQYQIAWLQRKYPVGALYMTTDDKFDPSSLFPSRWVKIDPGKILIGKGTFTDANGVTKTFDKEQTNEGRYMTYTIPYPYHRHSYGAPSSNDQGSGVYDYGMTSGSYQLGYTGGEAPHNNKQPCYAVNIWKRMPDEIPTLQQASWEFIAKIAEQGIAHQYWKIGDTKDIFIDGVRYTARLVDFKGQYTINYPTIANGYNDHRNFPSKQRGMTFAVQNYYLDNPISMDFLVKDFNTSVMSSALDLIFDCLQDDLKKYIRSVGRQRYYCDSAGTGKTDSMGLKKIWLPNCIQVGESALVHEYLMRPFDIIHFGICEDADYTFSSHFTADCYPYLVKDSLKTIYHNQNENLTLDTAASATTSYIDFCFFI